MNVAYRAGRWSAAHWKTATFGWLAVVLCALVVGHLVGTVSLTDSEQSTGESAWAQTLLTASGFRNHASESVLVQSILSKLDLPQSATDHRRVLAVLAYLQSED